MKEDTLSTDWVSDLRPEVAEGTREIIAKVGEVQPGPPTRTFEERSGTGIFGNTSKVSVPVPGEYLQYENYYEGEFESVSKSIVEHLPSPPESRPLSQEERCELVEKAVFDFVGIVLDYTGAYYFDEQAFNAAFAEQFEPRTVDRETKCFVLCLDNALITPDTCVELTTDIRGDPDYLGPYQVSALRIRPLDRLEETGIRTFDTPSTGPFDGWTVVEPHRPTPAIEIELTRRCDFGELPDQSASEDPNPWRTPEFNLQYIDAPKWHRLTRVVKNIGIRVRRLLRLHFSPEPIGVSKGFSLQPGWESYRGIATPVLGQIEFNQVNAPTDAMISTDDVESLERDWERYHDKLRTSDEHFQTPLSRFERMFSRESLEDQLVDCAIGCETSLLKGISSGGKQHKMGQHATALIGDQHDHRPVEVSKFFEKLYETRSEIVHEGESLPDDPGDTPISVSDRNLMGSDFVKRARWLFSDVLLEYLRLAHASGDSIDAINVEIQSQISRNTASLKLFDSPDLEDWMTPVDRYILERLWNVGNRELRLTPGMIAENVDWGDQAVREHVLELRDLGLIEHVDEDRGVYQISERGRAWLRGNLSTEELEQ